MKAKDWFLIFILWLTSFIILDANFNAFNKKLDSYIECTTDASVDVDDQIIGIINRAIDLIYLDMKQTSDQ